MPSINIIPIFYPCRGRVLKRTPRDEEYGTYPVSIYDSPKGPIAKLLTKLASAPGTEGNFLEGTHVIVMVCFTYEVETGRWLDIVTDAFHYIAGAYDPGAFKRLSNPHPNADIAGLDAKFVGRQTGCGLLVDKSGAVKIASSGQVVSEYNPNGNGIMEESSRMIAQNFHRIVAGNSPDYLTREHFGLFVGEDLEEKAANSVDLGRTLMAYRRFVQQSLDPDIWVSTCEGAYCPWVGSNNSVNRIEKNKEIIFNKIINHGKNRITISAGEAGPSFLSVRIDEINPRPANGEKVVQGSCRTTPVISFAKAVFEISEEGEVRAEFGINKSKQMAMSLTVTKDGDVNLDVGKSFKINGKRVLTEDFLEFFKKHQQDLVQVVSLGSPAPMSPMAMSDFISGSMPGGFMTDKTANDLVSKDTGLSST